MYLPELGGQLPPPLTPRPVRLCLNAIDYVDVVKAVRRRKVRTTTMALNAIDYVDVVKAVRRRKVRTTTMTLNAIDYVDVVKAVRRRKVRTTTMALNAIDYSGNTADTFYVSHRLLAPFTSHSNSTLFIPLQPLSCWLHRDLFPSTLPCKMVFARAPFALTTCPNHLGFLFTDLCCMSDFPLWLFYAAPLCLSSNSSVPGTSPRWSCAWCNAPATAFCSNCFHYCLPVYMFL